MRLRIATAMLGMAAGAYADDFTFARAEAVAEARLDGVRGGFELPANLRASLTLERAANVLAGPLWMISVPAAVASASAWSAVMFAMSGTSAE